MEGSCKQEVDWTGGWCRCFEAQVSVLRTATALPYRAVGGGQERLATDACSVLNLTSASWPSATVKRLGSGPALRSSCDSAGTCNTHSRNTSFSAAVFITKLADVRDTCAQRGGAAPSPTPKLHKPKPTTQG